MFNRRLSTWLMVLVLLAAAALRLPELQQIPPGPHYDEAANGILAADIGLRGERPVFISSYTGKEVLFFYFAGMLMRLLGQSLFSLRLTAAFTGLLTVAATYWLAYSLIRDRRVALIAGALIAISFWHLLFSRLGFRAITQPLLQALTIAALYQGLRQNDRRWLVFGGALLGASAYTYLAVRLFPVPLALALIPVLLERRNRRIQLTLVAAVALLFLAPLALYFAANPQAFWVRVGQVAPASSTLIDYLTNYGRSLGMFLFSGDPYWRFNIPLRPLFDWFWGGLMIAGWLLLLVRLREVRTDWRRSAYLLLLLVPFFMVLPTALAAGEITPSNLRGIGLLPFVYLLPAFGLVALVESLAQFSSGISLRLAGFALLSRLKRLSMPAFLVVVLLIFLVVGGARTASTYFNTWATRSDLFYDSDADMALIADHLDANEIEADHIFIASEHYRHPTMAFLSEQYDRLQWLPGSAALVFPETGTAAYIFPRSSPLPDWARDYLASASVTAGPPGPDGKPAFEVYQLSTPGEIGQNLRLPNNAYGSFDNKILLRGYHIAGGTSGGSIAADLLWHVQSVPAVDLAPFNHLEDGAGYRWSQANSSAYPAGQWMAGDIFVQHVEIAVPDGTPPGDYRLRSGIYNRDTGQEIAMLDEQGRFTGSAFIIHDVPVTAAPPPDVLPEPPNVTNLDMEQHLTLLGFERLSEQVASGGELSLALWWQADGTPRARINRLELVRADHSGYILANLKPAYGTYPFEHWSPPQFVIDRQVVKVPASFEPGQYDLQLRVLDAGGDTMGTADLGPLVIEEVDREFEVPDTTYPMAAVFGDQIALPGYDVEVLGDQRYRLRLFWQALDTPADSYTVFVHILMSDGSCCLWQQDNLPRQGQYPTSQWLEKEVIVDEYIIELPEKTEPGLYATEVGLYLADSGRRLLVVVPGLRPNDALYLRPLEIR